MTTSSVQPLSRGRGGSPLSAPASPCRVGLYLEPLSPYWLTLLSLQSTKASATWGKYTGNKATSGCHEREVHPPVTVANASSAPVTGVISEHTLASVTQQTPRALPSLLALASTPTVADPSSPSSSVPLWLLWLSWLWTSLSAHPLWPPRQETVGPRPCPSPPRPASWSLQAHAHISNCGQCQGTWRPLAPLCCRKSSARHLEGQVAVRPQFLNDHTVH